MHPPHAPHDNGMRPTADTTGFEFRQRRWAAGDAGR
jgi:hypothetical protein